ncbi:ABC transporter C family member 8 [Euphorbia peplus]|nr:ABC transporter C family member 8 [Euphorbia peplus]
MPFFITPLGELSWFCESNLQLASPCIQRTIIDVLNLIFLALFFLFLMLQSIRKSHVNASHGRDYVSMVVSIFSLLVSIAYLSVGIREFIARNDEFNRLNSFICLIRGVIWISLAVSLLVRKSKSSVVLVTLWWVCFSLLSTALNVEILVKAYRIKVLDLLSWPVSFLFLVCAFRSFSHFSHEHSKSLYEPLLDEKEESSQSELSRASFLSKLFFSWINPLLKLGYSKPLNLEDIPSLVPEDEADIAYREFAQTWGSLKTPNNNRNMTLEAVTRVHFKENIVIAVLALLRTIALVILPLLLYAFVNYASLDQHNLSQGLRIVGCLILVKVVESLSQRHSFFLARQSGMRMRSALMVAIYRKQLRLSSLGRRRHSTGEVVNYISVDAYRMGEFPWWFHTTWCLILQLFLSIIILFGVVGVGALIGLIPLFICGLLNLPFARIMQKCQSEFMVAQDERLRATSEILNSMKIIKLQSWEEKFKSFIELRRDKEFKWLTDYQFIKTYGTLLYWFSPTIISSVIFFGCALLRSTPLDASTIFTVLATLRCMAEPVRTIPEALSIMIQVKVSFDRINNFLLEDELNGSNLPTLPSRSSDESVSIQGGNFSWDPEVKISTLKEVNLDVKQGQKIAVCGPVGAGKSSLLYAILREIPKTSGMVNVFGSVAYVSQTSWIQSGTVRDNILFGKPMDKAKYETAIKASALDKDINSFKHGDLTEIGQRGLNMSGGQKQRIQLARAVYDDADIYLLDDPFSAVDAHTAALLFNDCVKAALGNKTVILVTHQVEFLSSVDRILVMEGGKITQSGSYDGLLMAGTAFEQLVNAHKDSITELRPSNDETQGESMKEAIVRPQDPNDAEISMKGVPGVQLTEEEEKEIGGVGLKPFFDYLVVSKGALLACMAVLSVSLSTGFVYLRSFFSAHLGLKASKTFFSGFTNAIFKAPMAFFDSTPIGRILTRASSDLSVLDFDIPFAFIFTVSAFVELISIIAIMASVTWQVLIVAILAIVGSKYVQDYYLASARELIRINGTTKAPVMNYAAETSQGVVTIRAFKMEDRFFRNYLKLVDIDAVLFFHSNGAMEWLILRIETLTNLTLFAAALLLIFLPKGVVPPGLVGLSLSYALSITASQVFASRWYCNLLNYIISVERIKQFMHIPPEPPAIVEDNRPTSSWPFHGRIELQELKIRYRPNAPLVLKGINCTFKERSRVGVVGRTGSGKTTLISALFRIIPQEPTLFRGSVRTNLDPLGLYSDHEIWEALEKCQLKATVTSLPNQLDSSVSEEGENWSTGQRQLFCLGRVVLKRNKILVLDEATASIDSATDAIVQRIIRREFSECTVITVAHRVPTVIDSDMVMVLSYGELLEYDEPAKLMGINSSFSKLVAEYWSSCKQNC